jgi:signal transduction histidine kinase
VVGLSACSHREGIAGDLLSRVFDLFTQTERSIDRAQGGLGIGLSLVKSLFELHGRTVAAMSEGPGQGVGSGGKRNAARTGGCYKRRCAGIRNRSGRHSR